MRRIFKYFAQAIFILAIVLSATKAQTIATPPLVAFHLSSAAPNEPVHSRVLPSSIADDGELKTDGISHNGLSDMAVPQQIDHGRVPR